ncbi:hypothetical protein K3L75_004562 [Escherichia coli]|nr:hypothetical protein [Escherichia coli]EHW9207545.1 hypothetical protein [Escherichia coli]
MKLLNIYEDKDEAEVALSKISGEKRLASERDGTVTIYNLFGQPTWGKFYKLDLFNLSELQGILQLRKEGKSIDQKRYEEIIDILRYVSRSFDLSIPEHWL